MLVLSRKKNETIRIAHDISIVVIDIRGDKVRLGIQAPASTPVHREEVYQAIMRQGSSLSSHLESSDGHQDEEEAGA